MADSALGSTSLVKKKKRDVNKCIICQQVKKKKEVTLRRTSDGIQKIRNASEVLKDSILDGLTETEIQRIQYHSNNCYSPYILKASRKNNDEKEEENQNKSSMCTPVRDQGISSPQTRLTARSFSPENVRTVCVICNHVKHKGVTTYTSQSFSCRISI